MNDTTDQTAANQPLNNPPTPNLPQEKAPFRKLKSKKVFIIAGVVLLLLSVLLGIVFSGPTEKPTEKEKAGNNAPAPTENIEQIKKTAVDSPNAKAASHLMVYGAWTGQTSLIKAVDVTNANNLLLATLPLQVKKVNILSDKSMLYIDQVDTRDHGKSIALYDMAQKKVTATIPAANGYGIDDYVLSPNKKYIAIWEVSFAPGSQILQGGRSRVYAVDLANPSVKNLLYDESVNMTAAVHYPRAVLNNGTVFSDTFMANDPNGGAGWAYGMGVVDFNGANKRDVENMKAGTYGTQPSLSLDGKYLVFSGYDGSKGDGKANVDGFRRALLTPNTVELLNTQTLQRFRLPNLVNTNSYTAVAWDQVSGNIIMTVLSKNADQTGTFSYDLAQKNLTKLELPNTQNEAYRYVSQLPEGRTLIAISDDKESNLGNLGDEYAYAFTRLSVMDNKNTVSNLVVQDSYVQYITMLPGTYFNNVLGTKTTKTLAQAIELKPTIIDLYSDKNGEKQNLQLYTFFLKSELAPIRLKQQTSQVPQTTTTTNPSKPGTPAPGTMVCQQLAEHQCKAAGLSPQASGWQSCITANREDPVVKCNDSPLYLYGPEGLRVNVAIQTPIFNATPASAGEYQITLGQNGDMVINDKVYKSIAYDYKSNLRRVTPPTNGAVVHKNEVEKVLRNYAKKLGLNTLETTDLVNAGKKKVTSQYAFVSFFDHETSQSILPIVFSPKPDNYLNVVFYFKLYDVKPSFTPAAPSFPEPVNRSGFTAVEVSEIVE